MELTKQQIDQFDRDGYLIFPDLLSAHEVTALRQEFERLTSVSDERVLLERSGAVRMLYEMHNPDSPTVSQPMMRLSASRRLVRPVQQVLKQKDIYIYHSKCNVKAPIDGAVWQWHQDYAYWRTADGLPKPTAASFAIFLDEATEVNGCLYFIPGSHKQLEEPELDAETTSFKLWVIPKTKMVSMMERLGDPVAITGKPGTGVLFHSQLAHGSGHNLSRHSRWQVYFCYSAADNRPATVQNPRPEWQRGTKGRAIEMIKEDAIV